MIFLELNFVAWGPFTDRRIDLSAGEYGLNVLFGPNEAGKSSALRGLRALLFGISGQTTDAFAHDYTALRIAARLRAKDGKELSFARRKGTKNTLLADDRKTALADEALRPFLGAVTPELFATHFAMGHDDLVRGGEEILAGQGDVGRSLFSAAVGGSRLREVIEGLDREAAELFTGRAQNPKVNQALRELDERHRAVLTSALSTEDWRRQQEALDAAIAERTAVGESLGAARVEVARLARLRDLLPKLDEWRAQRQRCDALGDVVLLRPEFGEERRNAIETRDRAETDSTTAEQEIAERDRELASLIPESALIEAGEGIDALHEALGSHRKAAKDRTGILQRKLAAENEAERLLRDLDTKLELKMIEQLRPSLALRTRVDALKTEGVKREAELKAATDRLADADAALLKAERESASLPPSRDPSALAATVEAALAAGQGADLAKLRNDASAIESQAQREIDRLGLWRGSLDAAERLPVPGEETIARFDSPFAEIEHERASLVSERARGESDFAEAERQIAQLVESGDVPLEVDLAATREWRDQLWALVRRAWLEKAEVAEAVRAITADPLPEAYEASVAAVDVVSDRLRREADRVAARAAAQVRRERAQHRREEIAVEEQRLAEKQAAVQLEWRAAWAPAGIEPRTPAEMRAFVAAVGRLRERAEKLREARSQIADRERNIDSQRAALEAVLRSAGESDLPADFTPLLGHARRVAAAIADVERRRTELGKQADEHRHRKAEAARTVEEATGARVTSDQALREATHGLPLRPDATATEAVAVLERLDQIVRKLDEAEREAVRLRAIDKDAERFRAEVAENASRLAPDLANRTAEEVAEQLHVRRGEARERAVLREQTERRRAEAARRRDETVKRLTAAHAKIQSLCKESRCAAPEHLAEAEARSSAARQIAERLAQLEGDLAALGATVAQAEAEAASADRTQIEMQIATRGQAITDDEQRDRELSERIGEGRKALQQMNGEAQAARAAEEEQAVLARIRVDAGRYVELRLAARLLRHEIERYRAAHQDPLLARASEIFVRLTLGSFARLEADFDDRDEPVLVGVRPTGGRVRVEGMSAGTRDQLHLALRLAHVDDQIRAAEPLPLVLDDLLVHFDDARSAAALSVLAEMSDRTQVLLFTHHERVRDLALEAGGKRAFVHDLRPTGTSP